MSVVAVIGAGYVGLTTASCFARLGHEVRCADIDAERVALLAKGEIPILEEGMPALVAEGLATRRLRFVVGAAAAVQRADFVFLCVGTPPVDDGSADLSALEAVAREVAPLLEPNAVVVNKSTVPVGTTRLVARWLAEAGAVAGVEVASNPEFLREGTAVRDFLQPNRIVVGCDDPTVAVRITELYRTIPAPIVVTDAASAEMIKQASNAYLAMKISFINAIANVCEAVNADVRDVALGMGYDSRIGSEFLHPGPGFGGACLPKDTSALLRTAEQYDYDFSVLRGVLDVNDRQRHHIVDKIRAAVGGDLRGARVGVLGLTFKANTDDLRDSPSLEIARDLVEAGAVVRAFDPVAGEAAGGLVPGLGVATDALAAADGADVLALLTEWDQFRWLDYTQVAAAMASPRVVDARNLLDPAAMRRLGFTYQGVGR